MHFRTEERKHEGTKVVEVVTGDFKEKVISTDEKCVVLEVYKKDCDSCHYNGRMFDVFSQKLGKRKRLN